MEHLKFVCSGSAHAPTRIWLLRLLRAPAPAPLQSPTYPDIHVGLILPYRGPDGNVDTTLFDPSWFQWMDNLDSYQVVLVVLRLVFFSVCPISVASFLLPPMGVCGVQRAHYLVHTFFITVTRPDIQAIGADCSVYCSDSALSSCDLAIQGFHTNSATLLFTSAQNIFESENSEEVEYFKRNQLTLMIESNDIEDLEPTYGLLTIGRNVLLNFMTGFERLHNNSMFNVEQPHHKQPPNEQINKFVLSGRPTIQEMDICEFVLPFGDFLLALYARGIVRGGINKQINETLISFHTCPSPDSYESLNDDDAGSDGGADSDDVDDDTEKVGDESFGKGREEDDSDSCDCSVSVNSHPTVGTRTHAEIDTSDCATRATVLPDDNDTNVSLDSKSSSRPKSLKIVPTDKNRINNINKLMGDPRRFLETLMMAAKALFTFTHFYFIGYGISNVFRLYPTSAVRLVYSLLIGRPVIVYTSLANHEQAIKKLITALWMFVPGYFSVAPWSTQPIRMEDLNCLKLIGLCTGEKKSFDCMVPRNVQTGLLLAAMEKRAVLNNDSVYIAYWHSLFFDLASKAFQYFHEFLMSESSSSSSSSETKYVLYVVMMMTTVADLGGSEWKGIETKVSWGMLMFWSCSELDWMARREQLEYSKCSKRAIYGLIVVGDDCEMTLTSLIMTADMLMEFFIKGLGTIRQIGMAATSAKDAPIRNFLLGEAGGHSG
ncbi:hypothetical protein HELRODRAFT_179012 [Helobdella robusta]|uniref:Uncharacterized protein n=1 Tax=Helobdella robusta TaxID=6412 RepID=T1FE20_HELRO|nr:hypothetical protein HELRODRAFT_179012 [Helobdella robusta]ESN95826.1 hypothetical protein HELRODRAFT_179012 [Helobdella robusta]